MIQNAVTKRSLEDTSSNKHDVAYQLTKTPKDRVADRVKEADKLGADEYVKKAYILERIGLAVRNEFHE